MQLIRIRSVLRLVELGAGLLALVVGIATLQRVLFGPTAIPVAPGRRRPADLFDLLLQSSPQLTFIAEAVLAAILVSLLAVAGCVLLHVLTSRSAARIALWIGVGVLVVLTAIVRVWDGGTFLFPSAVLALIAAAMSFAWDPRQAASLGVTTATA